MNATKLEIQSAFTEWDRRYREDPEAFMNEAARLLNKNETAETYGEAATPYFLWILKEIQGVKKVDK
jgi:hypothetical protein